MIYKVEEIKPDIRKDVISYVHMFKEGEKPDYGVYDCLNDGTWNKHSMGAINDKYLFNGGTGDHIGKHEVYFNLIGKYNIYFMIGGPTMDCDHILIIKTSHEQDKKELTKFQYECVIGVLEEYFKYMKENNYEIALSVGGIFLDSGIETDAYNTSDSEQLLNEVKDNYEKYLARERLVQTLSQIEPKKKSKIGKLKIFESIFNLNKPKEKKYHK